MADSNRCQGKCHVGGSQEFYYLGHSWMTWRVNLCEQ